MLEITRNYCLSNSLIYKFSLACQKAQNALKLTRSNVGIEEFPGINPRRCLTRCEGRGTGLKCIPYFHASMLATR